MEYNSDCVVLIAPKNWVHKSGVNNLFIDAKERLSLCYKYHMGSEKLKNILVVGYTQFYGTRKHTKETYENINKICAFHFK